MSTPVARLDWATAQASLGERWDLAAQGGDAGALFRSPAWFAAVDAWQARLGAPLEVWGWKGQGDLSLLPLIRASRRTPIPHRVLRLAVIPDSQFGDAPVTEQGGRALVEALLRDPHWDVLELDHLDEGGRLATHLLPALRACFPLREGEASANAWVDLSRGWEAYYATRSRRLKKGNNHIRNRLERAFQRIEVHRWDGGGDQRAVFERLVTISAASWKKETGLTLDNPAPRAFLEALFEHHAPRGELTVWWLELDGRAVASELQLHRDGHVYALRADYDQAYEEHSPGTYLFWRLLQQLQETGGARYWMGPGQNPYKERWLEGKLPLRRYRIYRSNLRGRLLHTLEGRVKPWMRGWMRRAEGKGAS